MEFMQKWYRKCVSVSDVVEVLHDWLQAGWTDGQPALFFMRPREIDTHPRRVVHVVNFDGTVVDLIFEHISNYIDPRHERIDVEALPQVVAEFLRVTPEDSIYIDLGYHLN